MPCVLIRINKDVRGTKWQLLERRALDSVGRSSRHRNLAVPNRVIQILSRIVLCIRAGAPMKVGTVEIGAVQTAQWHKPAPISKVGSSVSCLNPEEAVQASGTPGRTIRLLRVSTKTDAGP
jgi:hypothetical protein